MVVAIESLVTCSGHLRLDSLQIQIHGILPIVFLQDFHFVD